MHSLEHIRERLRHLVERLEHAHVQEADILNSLPGERRFSASNLIHYLCLRQFDLTDLQNGLSAFGLSSLGRCEGDVLSHCRRVLEAATGLTDRTVTSVQRESLLRNTRLESAAAEIFGDGSPRVMVTIDPSDADPDRLITLLQAGMRIARINAGHGHRDSWHALIASIRSASLNAGVPCRVLLDLPGPKIRIGSLPELPGLFTAKVPRDRAGIRLAHGFFQLTCTKDEIGLQLEDIMESDLLRADRLRFKDAQGKHQELKIRRRPDGIYAEHEKTVRILNHTSVSLRRKGKRIAHGKVVGLPVNPLTITVNTGDVFILVHRHAANAGTQVEKSGAWRLPCTWDHIFEVASLNQRIVLDDGRCSGHVVAKGKHWLRIQIDAIPGGTTTLRADQGINLPDCDVETPDLLPEDEAIITEFAPSVDCFGCSFVQRPETIRAARACLGEHTIRVGLVAKIETLAGCSHLADILLEGLMGGPFAVLVARGDLAVEVGFARLAEAQEEILWLCEAAHVPVIWGTQVLDRLAKKGLPTRSEVTDAAMASRAECIMLNKGPYVADAIRFLHEVVPRIRDQMTKKRALLRPFPLPLSGRLGMSSETSAAEINPQTL